MEKYYRERFLAQKRLARKVASTLEVNDILEKMREEARVMIPSAMEVCILLLDPDASQYTRPLQCGLYNRPVNCQSCKRSRKAIQKALSKRKGVVISQSEPIVRLDGSRVETGPEIAIPIFVGDDIVAVINVVSRPGTIFTRKDFYLIRDMSETLGNLILNTKKHWEVTQEKIRISQILTHLSPFVPQTVREIVEKNPETPKLEKEKKDVTVLFLDLEDYTRLSATRPQADVQNMIEKLFSNFVDPIHRSYGDINETSGDGLMIIFKDHDAGTNAVNAVKTALDIHERSRQATQELNSDFTALNVNMGINSGEALLGMTQFKGLLETRMTYTASGPVTNLAARLAAHAHGGDILIGEETKRLIEGLWPVSERGTAHLKGIEKPIKIYSLL